jgi:4-amino-4-deoxy-L-arabinose transferase-like glycosyltransferase
MVLNILQAYFTGLDGDETYYWTYSRHLQWGYFDHPPMVALSIAFGELFGHGALFTRAGTILLSSATIFIAFKALPDKLQNVKWFIVVFASVLIFHIYGFITTPDPSLLFFTALFFYAYKKYLQRDNFPNTLFLAASIIGMMYSKYHGVLPVFFTLLSNPKLILKRSAWLAVIIVIAAFVPHLYWQYSNDWPTVRYHLFERNKGTYSIDKTTNYVLGQLLIFGPLTLDHSQPLLC